ncbi:MAG: hypothetical protein IPM48_14710 [Saprospiraceae bacterium]|nr:hypothetical protein [Saprospiraceae bacterium]
MSRKIAPHRARKFAEEYVKNGMSSIKAIEAVEAEAGKTHSKSYLRVKAHRTLYNEEVQRNIEEILYEHGVSKTLISKILKRNIEQREKYPRKQSSH